MMTAIWYAFKKEKLILLLGLATLLYSRIVNEDFLDALLGTKKHSSEVVMAILLSLLLMCDVIKYRTMKMIGGKCPQCQEEDWDQVAFPHDNISPRRCNVCGYVWEAIIRHVHYKKPPQ